MSPNVRKNAFVMTANTTAQCVNHRLIWSSKRNMLHHLLFFYFFFFLFCILPLRSLCSQSTTAHLDIGCRHGSHGAGGFAQPGQREELHREHVRADQVPGVSAQGNQRHICEYFIAIATTDWIKMETDVAGQSFWTLWTSCNLGMFPESFEYISSVHLLKSP